MSKHFFLTFSLLFVSFFPLRAQDVTGDWYGVLNIPPSMKLSIVFHITKAGEAYKATMDSPDQKAFDLPASKVTYTDGTLKIEAEDMGATYKATMSDKGTLVGTFEQGSNALPLELSHEKPANMSLAKERPQTPKPPFSYYSENVTFENKQDNITLAGTLTLPKKEGKFPVVVLISGSGGQNRDEELLGHKPFAVLADHLTKQGIGVLRYDDRGIGESKGNFSKATSEDFARDVESAVAYLKTRPDINPKKIGLVGHSEGGLVAPMVASRNKSVAFIVMLAGPGVAGKDILVLQQELLMQAEGIKDQEIAPKMKFNKGFLDVLLSETDVEKAKEKATAYMKENLPAIEPTMKEEQRKKFIEAEIKVMASPWMLFFLRYNPAVALEKVKCPVLAVIGAKDKQVSPTQNLEPIRKALKKAGNKKATVKELPNLNHLFQECTTGGGSEYSKIEQTLSPIMLNEVTAWLLAQIK